MSTYRVGNHQPQNVYRGEQYIGVMFTAEDAALVVAALNGQRERLDAMAAMAVAYAEMRTALTALVDPDPCSYDHSGECQAHGQGSDPVCAHARARELLSGQPGPRPIRPAHSEPSVEDWDSCTCPFLSGRDPACPVHQGRRARGPKPPPVGEGCICDGSGRTCPRHGAVL